MTTTRIYAPGPVHLDPRVIEAGRNIMHHRSSEFSAMLRRVRDRFASLYSGPVETVLIAGSATYALEGAIGSFASGRKVLALTNGSYGDRLAHIATSVGADVRTLRAASAAPVNPALVGAACAARPPEVILLVHNETSSGVLNDVGAIAEIARETGATLIVDDVSALGCESMTAHLAAPHWVSISTGTKALESSAGIGAVSAPVSTWEERGRSFGFALDLPRHRAAQNAGTVAFTPPVQSIAALEVALELLEDETVASRRDRYARELAHYRSSLAPIGFTAPIRPEQCSCSILLLRVPGPLTTSAVMTHLEADHLVVYPGIDASDQRHIRVSSMGHHDSQHADILIASLARLTQGRP